MRESSSACRAEGERLLALAGQLEALTEGRDETAWKAWRGAVAEVLEGARCESVDGERLLDGLAARLREIWLTQAHRSTAHHFRSPPLTAELPRLPSGRTVAYSYERNVPATALERRCAAHAAVPQTWQSAFVAYGNGMAALAGVLQTYLNMSRRTPEAPLRLGQWGAYFETGVLIELLRGPGFAPRSFDAQGELRGAVGAGELDVVLVEPVRYDWELETLDLAGLARAWSAAGPGRPRVLVVDTTLVSPAWSTGGLLNTLGTCPPDLVVEIRSGLKLDQQGLELANAGFVGLYTRHSAGAQAEDIASVLRKMRTITGTGLSLYELAALEAPFVLDPQATRRHGQAVFLNNALVATVLSRHRGGLFQRIVHPSLGGDARKPWARAPFVVCHLAEDSLDSHGLLLAVVEHEARLRGLTLSRGSSFGFRGHRFETILPRLSDRRGLFKIAMGARNGPSRDRVVGLFAELAGFRDIAALRAAYPDVVPVDLTDLE